MMFKIGPQYQKEICGEHVIEVASPAKARRGTRSINRVWYIRFNGVEWTITGFAGHFTVKNTLGAEFQAVKLASAKARIIAKAEGRE